MESQVIVPVTVYWRPGCPFCTRLRRDLQVMGLAAREVNIWADPAAAARVRSLADGNETVPTVVIGERAFVNPSASQVLAQLRHVIPGFTPDEALARAGREMRLMRAIQWALVGALVAASFAAEAGGHSGLSWLADGVAVVVYLVFRVLGRRYGARGA